MNIECFLCISEILLIILCVQSVFNPPLHKILNLVAELNILCVKCAKMVDFPKFGHILYSHQQKIVIEMKYHS